MKKVRWGILSTSKFSLTKFIPSIQKGVFGEVAAISSRKLQAAQEAAKSLGIAKAYGSYEELLHDPEIDIIYNPLPNHMHVAWSIKALEAGKHVLCEKPVALSAAQGRELLNVSRKFPKLKIMEAFMYRYHPQWQKARALVKEGKVGDLKTIQCFFSYYNVDPGNIRNIASAGGGGMLDIGCYCISQSRFIFGREPVRATGIIEYDEAMKTDRMASGMLDFSPGTATFTCSTQLMPYQRVNIVGTKGRIEIDIPFNAPLDEPTKLWLYTSEGVNEMVFSANQYTIEGDLYSKAILNDLPVPTPLEDAIANMKIIDAVIKSAEKGTWEKIERD